MNIQRPWNCVKKLKNDYSLKGYRTEAAQAPDEANDYLLKIRFSAAVTSAG